MSEISDLPGSESRPDSRTAQDTKSSIEISISEDMRTFSTSTKSDRFGGQQDARIKWVDSEPRRYSTPVTDSTKKPTSSSGRRFTAIPVTTETGLHKVFFIGSPPDSPPRTKNSSSDSGSDPRRSIGGSSSDSVSVGSKRDSDSPREKSSKIPKLSLDAQMKENVDPKEESSKGVGHGRRSSQVSLQFFIVLFPCQSRFLCFLLCFIYYFVRLLLFLLISDLLVYQMFFHSSIKDCHLLTICSSQSISQNSLIPTIESGDTFR